MLLSVDEQPTWLHHLKTFGPAAMNSHKLNRFEWAKAVAKSELLDRAKIVAWALAVNFCNAQTGRTDPGLKELAAATGKTPDTLKRAIRDLTETGWLSRTEGRGSGNKTVYTFLSPGSVPPFLTEKGKWKTSEPKGSTVTVLPQETGSDVPIEKGGTNALSPEAKGAPVPKKGGTHAPSRHKEKQSFEQKGEREAEWDRFRFDGSAFDGPRFVKASDCDGLKAWNEWLRNNSFPMLRHCNVQRLGKGSGGREIKYFALPWYHPPTTPNQVEEARCYFASMIGQ